MLSGTARRTSSSIGGRPYRPSGSTASRGRANSPTAQLEVRRKQRRRTFPTTLFQHVGEGCDCGSWTKQHPDWCNNPNDCCQYACCKGDFGHCPRKTQKYQCVGHWSGGYNRCYRHGEHRRRQYRSWRITHIGGAHATQENACKDAFFADGGELGGGRGEHHFNIFKCFQNENLPGCKGHGTGNRITQWRDCDPDDHNADDYVEDHDNYADSNLDDNYVDETLRVADDNYERPYRALRSRSTTSTVESTKDSCFGGIC